MTEQPTVTARRALLADLRRYLVGPFEVDERLKERPIDRYHTGILSPPRTPISDEEDDQEEGEEEGEGGPGESILAMANVSQQSALGMTFQVDGTTTLLHLRASWASYTQQPDPDDPDDPAKSWWVRQATEHKVDLALQGCPSRIPRLVAEADGIRLYASVRLQDEVCVVTASVVNNRPSQANWEIDDRIYQVRLEAEAGGVAAFLARPPAPFIRDEELWAFELLYRDRKSFAVGHGCAVQWETTDGRRATRVWTEWVPEAEVLKASPAVLADNPILLLRNLSDPARRQEVCRDLRSLPEAYAAWVVQREQELPRVLAEFPPSHRPGIEAAARRNLECCGDAGRRIGEGIDLLLRDDWAWRAFCLANEAMTLSMLRARPDKEPRWFAFQLGFLLLSLPSSVDAEHPDRTIFDLIWFPTGGGKTEAYLGLAALCLFHRRLSQRPEEQDGTTVLTRYTLRLLTIQQFERAARMICSCEHLRRRDQHDELGSTEFSIGLFVGNSATPGTIEVTSQLLKGEEGEDGALTTLPLTRCPWCGTTLSTQDQYVSRKRLVTPCSNKACDFHKRLPVLVVDEEILEHPPSMVVATVDKFARMAWVPEIRALFGRGSVRRRPPCLIIQDELHLISDSLGTVAALYETAIDHLCTEEGRPPKVVGSTATIRRAKEQCHSLFLRRAVPFPPSGLLASDSFFYSEDHTQPGRFYVGVHAQGRSPKYSLAWVAGTLAQSATRIVDLAVRDSYYTLVLYFNSLRELGGALVMAEDEMPRYMQSMRLLPGELPRSLPQVRELTSHVPSSRIPELLGAMETPLPGLPGSSLDREPLDLVLATNMISVGIDVDRLGLMVVNGQPKTTSEYIQATSRVGRPRGSAGLVVTLYNWTRPRDRSHYERFVSYHQTFYRYVEPTSVTPFSERARDRALHAVLVSLARLLIDDLAGKEAGPIKQTAVERQVRQLAEVIVARARQVDPSEANDTKDHLDALLDTWIQEAEGVKRLQWKKTQFEPAATALLRVAESDNAARGLWPTPNSMRDVEPPAPVKLLTAREMGRWGSDGTQATD